VSAEAKERDCEPKSIWEEKRGDNHKALCNVVSPPFDKPILFGKDGKVTINLNKDFLKKIMNSKEECFITESAFITTSNDENKSIRNYHLLFSEQTKTHGTRGGGKIIYIVAIPDNKELVVEMKLGQIDEIHRSNAKWGHVKKLKFLENAGCFGIVYAKDELEKAISADGDSIPLQIAIVKN